jgi:hypothetical protein
MFGHKYVDTSKPYKGGCYSLDLICDTCGLALERHIEWACPPSGEERCAGKTPELGAPHGTKETNPKDAIGSNKAPMSTVPAGVLAEIGVAMLEGKAKYGAYNYRAMGVRASVYYDATMRHLMAWWEGEDTDPDSGMSHITKAITSLVVLRDAQRSEMVTDDRPPIRSIGYAELNKQSADIIERHKDKKPKHYTRADK